MAELRKWDRIRLICMKGDPDPVIPGTLGTVIAVRDYGEWSQVEVHWDNGRQLMLVMPPDQVEQVH